MVCYPDQVGLYDDLCSCPTEIEDNKTRFSDLKNEGLTTSQNCFGFVSRAFETERHCQSILPILE